MHKPKGISRAILATVFAALAASAGAAPVLQGTTTSPIGVDGVVIGGNTYNVSFSAGSYDSTYTSSAPTFLGSFEAATEASVAVAQALGGLGVTGLLGMDCATYSLTMIGGGCLVLTPFLVDDTGQNSKTASFYFGDTAWVGDRWGNATWKSDPLTLFNGSGLAMEFAVYSLVGTVPEPGSLALLGLAGAALFASRRRSNRR